MGQAWNMAEAWEALHGFIEQQAQGAPRVNQERVCPACGVGCVLRCGRGSGRWFWWHPRQGPGGSILVCLGARRPAVRYGSAGEAMHGGVAWE